MKLKKINDTQYFLLVEKKEKIIETITHFIKTKNIAAASINIIGGICNPILGHINDLTKGYNFKKFNGNYELIAQGNASYDITNNEPIIHIHATIGDKNFNSHTGHLQEAEVEIVGEIIINVAGNQKIFKKLDSTINLKAWDF